MHFMKQTLPVAFEEFELVCVFLLFFLSQYHCQYFFHINIFEDIELIKVHRKLKYTPSTFQQTVLSSLFQKNLREVGVEEVDFENFLYLIVSCPAKDKFELVIPMSQYKADHFHQRQIPEVMIVSIIFLVASVTWYLCLTFKEVGNLNFRYS